MEKKVLVLDLDGTLTNSQKEITVKTKEAIRKIQEEGHIVVLASGRPTAGILGCARELELEKFGGYILAFNGGRMIRCDTGEVVYQKKLSPELTPLLHRYAVEHQVGIMTYEGDCVIVGTDTDEYIELEARINDIPLKFVGEKFPDYVNFDVNKFLMTAPEETAPEHEKNIAALCEGKANVFRSEAFFIEVVPQNVDKAASLDVLLKSLGLSREHAICCGDGFNDISMIQYAGVGVAMANAKEKVKEAADYITRSNDEDGIVKVIEEFILS